MAVHIFAAAKHLANLSGWTLSNLEMQKILYLAHMFYLGRTGEPLVHGQFEAWDYGPVHPDLYHRVKIYGSDPVGNVFHSIPDMVAGPERDIISEAYQTLGKAGAGRLVKATHRPNGAWATYYLPGARKRVLPNSAILKEYQDFDIADAA